MLFIHIAPSVCIHFCCGYQSILGLTFLPTVIKILTWKLIKPISKHTSLKLFTGASTFIEALATNGTNIQTSVAGVTASKRRFIDERRDPPFDKRLRFSVRQTESAYRYRDIVVRKQDGFTHILLSTKSSENNSLNPEVRAIWFNSCGNRCVVVELRCRVWSEVYEWSAMLKPSVPGSD